MILTKKEQWARVGTEWERSPTTNSILILTREEQELLNEVEKINNMSHLDMVKIYRCSPSGHKYFQYNSPFYKLFMKRLLSFGGITL